MRSFSLFMGFLNSLSKYVIFTALAALCHCSGKPKEIKKTTIEDYLDEILTIKIEVDHLQENPYDMFTLVIKKNLEDGIEDIQAFIPTASTEEAFVYLSKEQVWVEIGRGTSKKRVERNVVCEGISLDVEIIQMVAEHYNSAVYGHTHRSARAIKSEPMKVITYESDQQLRNELKKIQHETIYEALYQSPAIILPSVADSISAVATLFIHYDANQNSAAVFWILNDYGITEYAVKPKAFTAFKSMSDATVESRVRQVITEMRDSHIPQGKDAYDEGKGEYALPDIYWLTRDEVTKKSRMARLLDDEHFRITYFSYLGAYDVLRNLREKKHVLDVK